MPIRKLSQFLINQIAAGEVIERPASVVKELVENSLDAGPAHIDIAIEDGGRQLIRIRDDGVGIPSEELPLAITAHATSKLDDVAQLAAVATLGFRGEALASIASVSRLRLTSCATTVDEHGAAQPAARGSMIEASGDQVSAVAPAACAPGTLIEVRDIFYNMPARRKFLKSASAEIGQISDLLNRIAMVHPDVGFKLTHNGRKMMDLMPVTDRAQRCKDVLGREIAEALLEFESARPGLDPSNPDLGAASVWGLAGLPEVARASSKFIYLCINGRPIRDRRLQHAIKEAYRGLMPPDRFPVAVIFIEVEPTYVDVNVHPAKAEVRLAEPNRMHGLVLTALRQRLLGSDLTPAVTFPTAEQQGQSNVGPLLNSLAAPNFGAGQTDQAGPASDSNSGSNAFVDYFRQMDPKQKGFVYKQVRQALAEEAPEALAEAESSSQGHAESPGEPAQSEFANHAIIEPHILQVHKSYLVTQDEHGILIIDQHALHERVMFEELSQRVLGQGKPLQSQRLLMPEVIDAPPRRMALLELIEPLLARIGIEAAPMGPDTLAIHAFPTFLFERKVDPVEFMEQLLDKVDGGQMDISSDTALEQALHDVLDMMACKAAVKAGDKMTADELGSLLAKRDEIERASNCPHGRPTTVRLSIRDLEKQFKRS
jgi:DNA mismatch repair protein MutL